MSRRCHPLRFARRLLLATLLGAFLTTGVTCTDTVQSAVLTGARSTASALLNAFFDGLASSGDFTPVTVKPIQP